MLKKLIKHEFQATARLMWPVFAGMAALTIVLKLCGIPYDNTGSSDDLNLLSLLAVFLFAAGMMGLCIAPLIVSTVRFEKSVLKDEGYLTMTLPVSSHQLLISKLTVSAVWYAAAFLGACLFFLIAITGINDIKVFPRFFADLFQLIGRQSGTNIAHGILIFIELILNAVTYVSLLSLVVYAACSIGYAFNKHKEGLTVLFILVFFIGVHILLFTGIFTVFEKLGHIISVNTFSWEICLGVALMFSLALAAVFYFITNYMITKKLNLE